MSNQKSTVKPQSALRRTVAGVVAAAAIAFGGVGMVSPADAAAAGVRQQTYVVQASAVQIEGATTGVTPRTED